jgi:hypothetical protein
MARDMKVTRLKNDDDTWEFGFSFTRLFAWEKDHGTGITIYLGKIFYYLWFPARKEVTNDG